MQSKIRQRETTEGGESREREHLTPLGWQGVPGPGSYSQMPFPPLETLHSCLCNSCLICKDPSRAHGGRGRVLPSSSGPYGLGPQLLCPHPASWLFLRLLLLSFSLSLALALTHTNTPLCPLPLSLWGKWGVAFLQSLEIWDASQRYWKSTNNF